MQILFRLVMPDEPATVKLAIVLWQKTNGDYVVHWQDLDYAAKHGEGSGYNNGFYPPDKNLRTAVADVVRRLQPKLEYHRSRGKDLDGIVQLAIVVETLNFALSPTVDAADLAALVDRLHRQMNQLFEPDPQEIGKQLARDFFYSSHPWLRN